MEKKSIRKKLLLLISIGLLLISTGLKVVEGYSKETIYEIKYQSINTKNMSEANIVEKKEIEEQSNMLSLINWINDSNENITLQEVEIPKIEIKEEENTEQKEEENTEQKEEEKPEEKVEIPTEPVVVENPWHLPTETGIVSQYPHYGHAAYDITSSRGTNEIIYPVANGVITNIYTDPAGALVITIRHTIGGQIFTSLYAHLSRYAEGIYIGKEVTYNDPIGYMGTTGYSTGVHLHLVVADCALFDNNDNNCKDLNSFFNFINRRVTEGYYGLGTHIVVEGAWTNR